MHLYWLYSDRRIEHAKRIVDRIEKSRIYNRKNGIFKQVLSLVIIHLAYFDVRGGIIVQTGTNMLAFGQLFEGAYMVDKDRTILFWNKAAENLTGYRASEVVGKHCDDNLLMHVNEKGENLCKEFCPLKQS